MACMHAHMFFGVKQTVLIPEKKIHPSALNNARVLNNAQAQNNARFWDAFNISTQRVITGFYGMLNGTVHVPHHLRHSLTQTRDEEYTVTIALQSLQATQST